MKTLDFSLSMPFKYSSPDKGGEVECNHIELREPTGKVSHITCAIEGMIQSAILSMHDTISNIDIEAAKTAAEAKSDDDEKDPKAMMAMIVGSGVEMDKIVLHFKELFKNVAYMGGEKLITEARLNDMSHTDLRLMIGTYAANFIMSW